MCWWESGHHPAWGSNGLELVDMDGDGDLDALVCNGDALDDMLPDAVNLSAAILALTRERKKALDHIIEIPVLCDGRLERRITANVDPGSPLLT